jgi:hypothetical protein
MASVVGSGYSSGNDFSSKLSKKERNKAGLLQPWEAPSLPGPPHPDLSRCGWQLAAERYRRKKKQEHQSSSQLLEALQQQVVTLKQQLEDSHMEIFRLKALLQDTDL